MLNSRRSKLMAGKGSQYNTLGSLRQRKHLRWKLDSTTLFVFLSTLLLLFAVTTFWVLVFGTGQVNSVNSPLFHGNQLYLENVSKPGADEFSYEWEKDPEYAPIMSILLQAGYDLNTLWQDDVIRGSLPNWSDIQQTFGSKPRIYGMETCKQFQKLVPSSDRRIGVAGIFNSGTNLLSNLLFANCFNEARTNKRGISATGVEWQVPWGKHVPPSNRLNHSVSQFRKKAPPAINVTYVLPVVAIRDPYYWMTSMCRQSYNAQFEHSIEHCPNIKPYPSDIAARPRFRKMNYVPVWVSYGPGQVKYESLAHMWNEWYLEYIHVDFPRLIVRLEDLVFHAEETISQVCRCGGATLRPDRFMHIAAVANLNPGIDAGNWTTGLLGSLIRYGNYTKRREKYTDVQLNAAREILNRDLMDLFGFSYE